MNLLKDITKLNEVMDLDDESKPLWDQIESIYVECLKEGDKNLELNESPLH
jgi:hypothetical protein